jgi:lipopolysaccharide transport system permease protein
MLKSLWHYRNFVMSSIWNELFTQFIRSKFGGLWIVVNPLFQVMIYTLILSNILAAKLPGIENKYAYAIYLMAGLLAWNLFSDILGRCLNLFISQANIIKKVNFPRITLPIIVVGVSLFNNFLLFISMLLILLLLGHQFTLMALWIIPLTLLVVLLALSIGIIIGVLNIFLRDIGQAFAVILQAWFWLTPIVYPSNVIPENYRYLLQFNPIYPLVDAYHQVLVYNQYPHFQGLLHIIILTVVLLLLCLFLFRKASAEMVDVL